MTFCLIVMKLISEQRLRIAAELMLETTKDLPQSVDEDIRSFIESLEQNPFDSNSLKQYGLKNQDVIELLRRVYIYN